MNLTQLKYFNSVCEHGKVSVAAEVLHISQPSISNSIKELECEFGISLFQRQHSGMTLTPEGKTLYKLSKDLLMRADQIQHIMSDMGNERKTLRLGVPPMIGALILPYIYGDFQKAYPDISLEITESGREQLLNKLSDDYLDMIFMPHNEPLNRSLVTHNIARLEIVCCTSKNNSLSEKEKITPKHLVNVPVVMFKNSFFQTEQIKKWFSSGGVEPDILLQTDQLSTIQSLISKDMAVGFMFKELIKFDSNFSFIPTYESIYADISLVWKKEAYMLGSMKKLKDFTSSIIF